MCTPPVLKFYDIDTEYADFLRKYDGSIPNIKYGKNNKFACGVVLSINGYKYFAPISSNTKKQQTSILIYNKDGKAISSIKLCFMFPAPPSAVSYKNFAEISKQDPAYARLLEIEWRFCRDNESVIYKKANKIYGIGRNKSHVLNKYCCDFLSLEVACDEWMKGHNINRLE